MTDYDVVVIGAGLGGLSAAALCQHRGLKTIVFENSSNIGGCCSSYTENGYTFDTGASVVELNFVIDELFMKLGRKTIDYINFQSIDPIYGFLTEDGQKFSYPVSAKDTRDVIARFDPDDGPNWDRFCKVGAEAIEDAFGKVMTKPMMTFSAATKIFMENPKMAKVAPAMIKNFEQVLTSSFKNEKVRASMSLQSYFLGLPPALCPGYVAYLAYSEHMGITYPKGGMIGIPNGMLKALQEDGGTLKLKTRVEKILTEGKKVIGVKLADGTEVRSKIVVSDVNARVVYEKMIGEAKLPIWANMAIKSYPYSIPAPMVCLGLDAKPDLSSHHTFCYTTLEEMNNIWFRDYVHNKLPLGGFMLISWPTHADPSMAPKGHHSLNLVTFAPYNLADGDWDNEEYRERYLEATLDTMEKKFHLDLRKHITVKRLIDPKSFERRFLHPQGAVYGLMNDFTKTAMFRPRMRSPLFKGLYLAGASVHLGGGVPPTTASGVCVGDLIAHDYRL